MRILVVSTTFPDDPRVKVHGVFKRLRMLVDGLRELGRLELLFFVEPRIDTSAERAEAYRRALVDAWGFDFDMRLVGREPPPDEMTRWQVYGRGLLNGFRQWRFRWADGPRQREALETALARDPDVLVVHRLTAMAPVLKTSLPLPPVVFDLDDIEHISFIRSIPQPPFWAAKRLQYLQVPALWWTERRAIRKAQRTFVCSEADRRYIARTMRIDGVSVIPNGVEVYEPSPPPARPSALFLGSLSYGPNQNAAGLLLRDIWPRVRELVSDAELTIAGRYAERVPGYDTAPPGVRFPGFVDDLDGLYAATRVVCVPILAGGGTRIKILEAAAYGKAIVATPVGAEGLAMEDGTHFLEREDVQEFAEAVAALMRDDERCAALGRAANDFVRREYSRESVLGRIRQEVEAAVSEVDARSSRSRSTV